MQELDDGAMVKLTPRAKYKVRAMLPKYVAVKGNLSVEIRWRAIAQKLVSRVHSQRLSRMMVCCKDRHAKVHASGRATLTIDQRTHERRP